MHLPHILKKIAKGQSVARVYMNDALRSISVTGDLLDVGGARNPDYFSYFRNEGDVTITTIDGQTHAVDFEKDALPYENGGFDTVVLCNVLEHIFNHGFLTGETYRILKPGGKLVGFVPFFIQYHADPHDYFRYTDEALTAIFTRAGFSRVSIIPVGKGPFLVHCNNLIQRLPRIVRPVWFLWCLVLDVLFVRMSKQATKRFPLGYAFVAHK